jgi:hypothetical protein
MLQHGAEQLPGDDPRLAIVERRRERLTRFQVSLLPGATLLAVLRGRFRAAPARAFGASLAAAAFAGARFRAVLERRGFSAATGGSTTATAAATGTSGT